MNPLSYRQVLDQYDRAKAFGETRSLPEYSAGMNDLYGTDAYSEGQRDGWWTRASTRADQFLENSIAGDVLGGVGGAVGSLFDREAQGEEIGRKTPRGILNTLPLILAELGSGGAATPAIAAGLGAAGAAGTGLAFGANTYADTGSARNALISGVTGAVLPSVGRLGGMAGLRLAGAPLARGLLTDAGEAAGLGQAGNFTSQRLASSAPEFLSQYLGSQAGQFGASAVSAKLQNPQEDVLSKNFATDFLLGQIPFTALDTVHAAGTLSRGLPSREAVSSFVKPEEAPVTSKPFVPSSGSPEETLAMNEVLQRHAEIANDPTKTMAEKSAALAGLNKAVENPGDTARTMAGISAPEVTVKGWTDGSNRILVDEYSGDPNTLPEHKTVFFNPEKVKYTASDDYGHVTFTTDPRDLKPAEHPLRKPSWAKESVPDPTQPNLSVQEKPLTEMPFAKKDETPGDTEGPVVDTLPKEEDPLQKIRAKAPVDDETKQKLVAMGVPVHQVLRIGENIPKSADPILNSIRGNINLDPEGRVVRLGNTDIGVEGKMNENRFLKRTQMPKEFLTAAKEMYPEAFGEKGMVDVNALVKGLQERPMVTVRRLDISDAGSLKDQERAHLHHELDTRFPRWNDPNVEMPPEIQSLYDRYKELEGPLNGAALTSTGNSESATARFSSVNPYPPEVLRGKKEVAPGHKITWAGDLTGNIPVEHKGMGEDDTNLGEKARLAKFTSDHYSAFPAGANQLFFVRAALHEFQPGARLPNGKIADRVVKIFEVWERQGDAEPKSIKEGDKIIGWQAFDGTRFKPETPTKATLQQANEQAWKHTDENFSPILRHGHDLAMEAAVQQARALGADAIALSDAESAMMTEGHDRQSQNDSQTYVTEQMAKDKMADLQAKGEVNIQLEKEGDKWAVYWDSPIPQSPGMTAAYDVRGPKTLEKITGRKGERVDFGEHQNAQEPTRVRDFATRDEALDWVTEHDPESERYEIMPPHQSKDVYVEDRTIPKGSPVFKDAKGSPKTSNTARLFSLDKISAGLSEDDTLTLKEAVHRYDMAQQRAKEALAFAQNARKTPEEMAAKATKEDVEKRVDTGLSPTQAVEHANLETAGKEMDVAMTDAEIAKAVARSKAKARFEGRERTQFTDEVIAPTPQGEHTVFPSRADAMEYIDEHATANERDLEDFAIIDAGKNSRGERKGFTVREKANRKISLDIQDSGGHERVADTQAEFDREESTKAPSPISETSATKNLVDGLREWTSQDYADAADVEFPEAQDIIRDANAGLDSVEKNKIPTEKEQSAMRKLREAHLRLRNYTLGSSVPHDEALVKEMGILEHPLNWLTWYTKEHPKDFMSALFTDLVKLSWDSLNSVKWTDELRYGWHYIPAGDHGPAEINIPSLPVDREDAAFGAWNLAHEITHHMTRDLDSRNDAAAVKFRDTVQEIRDELQKSKLIPKVVKDAISEAKRDGLYKKFANEDFDLQTWFNKRVGEKNAGYMPIFYGLLDHHEFIANVFGDKSFVSLLASTERILPNGLKERVLDWLSRAWRSLVQSKAGTDNALTEILTRFDDYLGKPKGYNSMDLIRDKLIAHGVRPDALASRIFSVKELLKTGSLDASVAGWKREDTKGLLPTSSTYADPAMPLDLPPLAVGKAVLALPPDAIPATRDLWLRLHQDTDVANTVVKEKGVSQPRELATSLVKVRMIQKALQQYERAQERFKTLDNFDGGSSWRDGMEGRLRNVPLPQPLGQTGNEDLAHGLMGLRAPLESTEEVRSRTSVEYLNKGVWSKAKDFVEKNLMLGTHYAKLYPAQAGRQDVLQQEQGEAMKRVQELHLAYHYDPAQHKITPERIQNNVDVTTIPRLNRVASDLRLMANELNQGGALAEWTNPRIQERVKGLSSGDKEKIRLNYESFRQRQKWNTEVNWPKYYDRVTPIEAATTIAAREGILPESAKAVATDFYNALKEVRDPNLASGALTKLQSLSTTLSPGTVTKVIDQINGAIASAEDHISFLRSRPEYTSEQRYGKTLAKMTNAKGESIMLSSASDTELKKQILRKQQEGAKLVYVTPKGDANVSGQTSIEVMNKLQEVEGKRQQRLSAALEGAPSDVKAALLDQPSLTQEVQSSLAAMQPLPGTARKFREGREAINMLENDDAFFLRQNNWMRHKLVRAGDQLQRLHPEIAGNLELKKFGDQMLEAFLTPDNAIARRLTSATYFYKLAFEFGNSFLESFQHLTTGMQALISETGSVSDAGELVRGATKAYWGKIRPGGKWANPDHQWLEDQMKTFGHDVASGWNDIHDPDSSALRMANSGRTLLGKGVSAVDHLSKNMSGLMQKYGNYIGMVAGFDLARSRGMDRDAAFKYAVDSKNLGMYTGGKAQRSGLWRIKTKAVPQLLSSLQTYTQGWFGQMYSDYVRGFSKNRPAGLSQSQIVGSKKAFLYGLAAQATLAGALGLPGVGQGLALLQQGTGLDLKGWTRGHLQSLFDEDQEQGGLISGIAMNGVLAGTTPFDPSGRAAVSVPFTGVSAQKGFDIASLAGAPTATVSDFAKGLFATASGSRTGWELALPNVLKRPARLAADDWDVRDQRGGLLYSLSPAERAMTLLGLPPSRVQRARDVAQAAKTANDAAVAKKEQMADSLAKMFTEQGPAAVQQRLVQLKAENPEIDLTSLVKSIAQRRARQTTPYDWRRETNPGAELAGLNVYNPSTVALGRQIEAQTSSALGLRSVPNPRADMEALAIDHLLNSGAAKTEAEARKMLQRGGKRTHGLELPSGYSQ